MSALAFASTRRTSCRRRSSAAPAWPPSTPTEPPSQYMRPPPAASHASTRRSVECGRRHSFVSSGPSSAKADDGSTASARPPPARPSERIDCSSATRPFTERPPPLLSPLRFLPPARPPAAAPSPSAASSSTSSGSEDDAPPFPLAPRLDPAASAPPPSLPLPDVPPPFAAGFHARKAFASTRTRFAASTALSTSASVTGRSAAPGSASKSPCIACWKPSEWRWSGSLACTAPMTRRRSPRVSGCTGTKACCPWTNATPTALEKCTLKWRGPSPTNWSSLPMDARSGLASGSASTSATWRNSSATHRSSSSASDTSRKR
mmetsp:Transcript_75372/g.207993  ORF Transcript_75372/g.207993 Transcript_75372/m.207993 type:complete len:319 (-) Transcript_75372:1953-2909(-)